LIWWGGDNFVMGRLAEVPDEIEVWGVVTTVIHRYRP
jgi:hypothetical protein